MINDIRFKKILLTILITGISILTFSQKPSQLPTPEQKFNYGIGLFEQGLYSSALKIFDEITQHENRIGYNDISADAEFYSAICALELQHNNAEYLITNFIDKNPESPRIQDANYYMGRFKYSQEEWKEAAKWFEKVDRYLLDREKRAEYYFKRGYAQLMLNEEEKANKLFFELKEYPGSDYYGPGVYYYSHIEYKRKNYQTALKGFNALNEDPTFSPIVPYYIAHIYFLQKKYKEVIEYIPGILDKVTPQRKAEMQRMLGDAHFRLEHYTRAIEYLEEYKKESESFERFEIYQLAYAYYKSSKYKEASTNFSMITNSQDSLTQNAYYHLADCYLKMDDKKNAHLAFGNASKMDFLPKIKEDALFNYAKLTYELSFAPFDETIQIFHSYLDNYNNTTRSDLIYNYLVDVYLTSKNYKSALESIEKIKTKNRKMKQALQRVAYYRGIELYNNLKYSEAIPLFNKSRLSEGKEAEFVALAHYWTGEAFFKLTKYKEAIDSYNNFLTTPGAFGTPFYNLANYNIGYCYFKQEEYNKASIWFRKYIDNQNQTEQVYLYDALLRLGDSYFVQRKYNQAESAYEIAVEINNDENDYAIFQQGFTLGILRKNKEKIETLRKLASKSSSIYADDAMFEIGKSFVQLNQNDSAIKTYEKLIIEYPKSNYVKKSHLQAGLMYFNQGKNDEAEKQFKYLIENYKGSDEYREALVALKNVYLDKNNVNEYIAYAKENKIDISSNEQDSLLYLSAEKAYLNGDIEHSQQLFTDYLDRFPEGQSTLKANFYLAQSYFTKNEKEKAVSHYKSIIKEQQNTFTETALFNMAVIMSEKEKFDSAYQYFNQLEPIASNPKLLLEARIGMMRTAIKLEQHQNTVDACSKVLMTDKVPESISREARFSKAKALLSLNKTDEAITQFRIVGKNAQTKEGAEAKYIVAKTNFDLGKTALAENDIMKFIKEGTNHQYWLGKSFILLARIYLLRNETFQAKAYLQSVIDNYGNDEDGIKKEALDSLKSITSKEDKQFEEKKSDDIEINLDKSEPVKEEMKQDSTKQGNQ